MASLRSWISALRLRTLPLALSSIGMGAFLAAAAGAFDAGIFALCCSTTLLLQILSNLANDYGDSLHGADHEGRLGPQRAVQSGAITPAAIKKGLGVTILLCLVSGTWLLVESLGWATREFFTFLGLGLLAIVAAVAYTMGRRPYGYQGLGDVSVLIFFGLVGVLGSYYLLARDTGWSIILPALSCGFLSMGVLNINNLRDMESDRQAGKFSIPVRLGRDRAVIYHWFLLTGGLAAALVYVLIHFHSPWQLLFLGVSPLVIRNGLAIQRVARDRLDNWLRQLALATLLFVILFGMGQLIPLM
jgi:1,4-dihydroxy-2-naphthoate octaprenyltransferase